MEDTRIIELYFARSETALSETARKYGKYCHYIAFRILQNDEDSEECVNDTYLNVWNSIPPHRPDVLKSYIGKITRNLSLNKYRSLTAEKRGKGQMPLVIDELQECLPSTDNTENIIDDMALADALNHFLASLSAEKRRVFIRRYWYFSSIQEIADDYGLSESKVKMLLMRSRNGLRRFLQEEGISV